MKRLFALSIGGLLLLAFAACGTAAPAAAPTDPPPPQQAADGAGPAVTTFATVEQYAAAHAGGPGAIYVGDLTQLVGPAPHPDLGDLEGNVNLEALEKYSWVFEHEFYQRLLEDARLTNPTPLTTSGQKFVIQHVCINRALLPCKQVESYLAPNVYERTQGQLEIRASSLPELGLDGTDSLGLVERGTMDMANIYGGYVAGDLPALEIQYLWGLFPDKRTNFEVNTAIVDDLSRLVAEGAGGAKIIGYNWFNAEDQVFFSRVPLRTLDDFKGKKVRSHGAALTDWIEGMGAEAQFVAFAETYTALERGVIDAGVSGAIAGYGLRWYEVAKYYVGPLVSMPVTQIVMNQRVWDRLPEDLQQILTEEAAKSSLEALRHAPVQMDIGLIKNERAGMEHIPFCPEAQERIDQTVIERVIPNWVRRTGGPDSEAVQLFNEKVGPIVGIVINPDGTASRVGQ